MTSKGKDDGSLHMSVVCWNDSGYVTSCDCAVVGAKASVCDAGVMGVALGNLVVVSNSFHLLEEERSKVCLSLECLLEPISLTLNLQQRVHLLLKSNTSKIA